MVWICTITTLLASPKTILEETRYSKRLHTFGVQVGTDVGGALPTKLEFIPEVFTPYPKLSVSLGAYTSFSLSDHWDLKLEANYKTVEMSADAFVENQLSFVPDESQETGYLRQYFSGRAKMNMAFTMLELPLYAVYTFPSYKNKLIFGGYGAWTMMATFQTLPQYGFIGSEVDEVGIVLDSPLPADDPSANFSKYMDNWDAGIVLGYEREIIQRINIGLKLYVGFKDIFKPDIFPDDPELNKILEYNMSHMRGALTLSYDIFQVGNWWWEKKKNSK